VVFRWHKVAFKGAETGALLWNNSCKPLILNNLSENLGCSGVSGTPKGCFCKVMILNGLASTITKTLLILKELDVFEGVLAGWVWIGWSVGFDMATF
jgi:hypothetical protein